MSSALESIRFFKERAPVLLSKLSALGFERRFDLEESKAKTSNLVFVENNVGFIFSCDALEKCVDAQVVMVREGRVCRTEDGGYSANIFAHLINYCGYRGGSTGPAVEKGPGEKGISRIEADVLGWMSLLRAAGQELLLDTPASLGTRSG